MSSSVYDKQPSSPVQTRRARTTNNNDAQNGRRSISNTIRNLFRKNSASPTRTVNHSAHPSPALSRKRSQSPGLTHPSNEAPHLRAPVVRWPFGKKKTKKSVPSSNVSRPMYEDNRQTSIHGQNFVQRSPELGHGGTIRSHSSGTYDAATKGFRDYSIFDQSQQVVIPDADIVIPPPYISDHSRSPSLNRQRYPDTSIDYSYRQDISANGIIHTPQQQRKLIDNPSITTTSILAQKSPILPTRVPSNRWTGASSSSLNNTDLRPIISSTNDTDVPKLNAPLIPLGSTASRQKPNRSDLQTNFNEKYNSSSNVQNSIQSDQSYRYTYGSLPDAEILHNNTHNSLKPIRSNNNTYPGLSAIIKHHIDPNTIYYNQHSPLNSHRGTRFDTSTTTNDYQWSNGGPPSPPTIHHHDGYIRPLTPQKTIQSDIMYDESYGRSPLNHHVSEPPVVYRSSTTIYTKDKRNYGDSGRIQTWNAQENDRNSSISYPISSPRIRDPYDEEKYHVTFEHEPQYFDNRYSNNNSSFSRRSIEREKTYDQPTRSYIETERTQEPIHTIAPIENYEVGLRHVTLKRSNTYDGLGILLTADADTRLNHRIHDIETSSPAYRAGLRKNDRIISVNGINVENVEFGNVLLIIKEGLKNNNLQISVINESTFI